MKISLYENSQSNKWVGAMYSAVQQRPSEIQYGAYFNPSQSISQYCNYGMDYGTPILIPLGYESGFTVTIGRFPRFDNILDEAKIHSLIYDISLAKYIGLVLKYKGKEIVVPDTAKDNAYAVGIPVYSHLTIVPGNMDSPSVDKSFIDATGWGGHMFGTYVKGVRGVKITDWPEDGVTYRQQRAFKLTVTKSDIEYVLEFTSSKFAVANDPTYYHGNIKNNVAYAEVSDKTALCMLEPGLYDTTSNLMESLEPTSATIQTLVVRDQHRKSFQVSAEDIDPNSYTIADFNADVTHDYDMDEKVADYATFKAFTNDRIRLINNKVDNISVDIDGGYFSAV